MDGHAGADEVEGGQGGRAGAPIVDLNRGDNAGAQEEEDDEAVNEPAVVQGNAAAAAAAAPAALIDAFHAASARARVEAAATRVEAAVNRVEAAVNRVGAASDGGELAAARGEAARGELAAAGVELAFAGGELAAAIFDAQGEGVVVGQGEIRIAAGDGRFSGVLRVSTMQRAVAVLEEGRRIHCFLVALGQSERQAATTAAGRAVRAAAFRRFVESLGDPNGRAIVMFLSLQGFQFVSDVGFRTEDVRTLFGAVLPKMRGLLGVYFKECQIDASLIRLLDSARTTTSTSEIPFTIKFDKVPLDHGALRAIAGLVTRRVSPPLILDLDLRRMGPAACKVVCGCLPHCTSLHGLTLHLDEVLGDTLDHVAATSSMKTLSVSAFWTPEAVQSLAKQLRINTSLETLTLSGGIGRFGPGSADFAAHVEETVRTYNYTLQAVTFRSQGLVVDTPRISSCLERNRWIRSRIEELLELSPTAAQWPLVLGMASGLPSLAYSVLRRGGGHAFIAALQGRSSDGQGGPRDEADG